MRGLIFLSSVLLIAIGPQASAQSVVSFDFDNAPLYTPLPIDVVSGGVTAHLSATGQGYSIQSTSTAPVVPVGFTGRFIYPSSVFLADLLISFSQTVTTFSIMYSPQELGCDDSALMRVTAHMNGALVGTTTTTAPNPGTWPVHTLACSFAQGFNSVVVHYAAHPPTCTDYGVIFIADNMTITVPVAASIAIAGAGCGGMGSPAFTCTMPRIGQNVTLGLSQATPAASGYLYYGLPAAVPLALGSCHFVQIDLMTAGLLIPVTTDAFGAWSGAYPVPPAPSMAGAQFALQIALFPTGGPLGLDVSNGLIATIGY